MEPTLWALGPPPSQVEPDKGQEPSVAAGPPEASRQSQADQDLSKHHWRRQHGRCVCTRFLSTSRTAVPNHIFKCKGLATNIQAIFRAPKGHKLHIATFSDGASVPVVISSQCGRFTPSNRKTELHKKECPGQGQQVFQLDGARAAYGRVCEGKHPAYKCGVN